MTVLGGKKMELSAYRCESNLEVVQSCSCTLAIVLLHLSVQSIPGTRGMEKMMTCYFLILLTCSVLNGNNWK